MSDFIEEEEGQEEEEKSGGWLTTWADMMSVLLTFFIVLQAFSTISERKFQMAVESIREAFSVTLPVTAPGVPAYRPREASVEDFEEAISEEDIDGISVEDYGDRMVVTVESELLFPIGKADLTPQGAKIMESVATALKASRGQIRVEGHTCDLKPRADSEFPDNWRLSTARALTVVGQMEGAGVPSERLTAAGRGEYDPVAPNDSEPNRRKNRRVQFVIERARPLADDS